MLDWLLSEDTPRPAAAPESTSFTDSRGYRFALLEGYRDWLKPGWETIFEPDELEVPEQARRTIVANSRRVVENVRRILRACGVPSSGGDLLEVGCHMGGVAYAFAAYGDFTVTAIDLPEYYVQQSRGVAITAVEIGRQANRLARLRASIHDAFLAAGVAVPSVERVIFRDEDICATALPAESFDVITSWQVLEHVREPEVAFREMFRLLRPGGVAFHEYNPFFCIEGGHSLCTLDFPYGHARLTPEDFKVYVQRFRPEEAEVALQFFHKNLNRMTLGDLRRLVQETGFDVLAIVEWPQLGDLGEVDSDTLRQVQNNFPTVTLNDLLARRVWVILRRPEGSQ